jgi:epoxyqueuosine reductase
MAGSSLGPTLTRITDRLPWLTAPPARPGRGGDRATGVPRRSGKGVLLPPFEAPVEVTASSLRDRLARCCPAQGIDLVGIVSLPCRLPHAAAWRDWLARDRSGELAYLSADPAGRLDPTRADPWACSLLVFAQRYTDGWPVDDEEPTRGTMAARSWLAGVSRYARGLDYHDVFKTAARRVLADLGAAWAGLRGKVSVDTGPYLEREFAWLAGLGFFGKNTCLIHERLGSGLFLAVAVTNLQVSGLPAAAGPARAPLWEVAPRTRNRPGAAPSAPSAARLDGVGDMMAEPGVASRCGRCRRCLEACPTRALVEPFVLDAGRCLSTWSIEWRGRLAEPLRPLQNGLLFGCDICQAVCPWNHKAARGAEIAGGQSRSAGSLSCPPVSPPPREYAPLPEHDAITLADLLSMPVEEYRRRFRRTPLWRAHPEGMRLNALTVAANTGRRDLVDDIAALIRNDSDRTVREAAEWALARLRQE